MVSKPTIKDVAKKANVSVATVSRVINNLGGVRKETEDRIRQAIEELNYVPNAVARSMVNRETKTIGVIIPDISNPFFSSVFEGIEKMAASKDYFTTLSISNESAITERKIVNHLIERGVDGVIIITADENGEQIKPLIDLKIPVVAVDRMIKKFDVDTVIINNREGAYEATKHLIDLGHENIAIIRGPMSKTPGLERYEGYVQALEDSEIPINEEWIGDGDFSENSGYRLAKKILQLEHPPTAIFSCNNLMSIGALKAIYDLDLRIGKDVSFVGFDDIELATFIKPQLTMISRPMKSLGEIGFQLLLDRMNEKGKTPSKSRKYVLSPHLIVRESGGIIKSSKI